jgi:hypothetical protein
MSITMLLQVTQSSGRAGFNTSTSSIGDSGTSTAVSSEIKSLSFSLAENNLLKTMSKVGGRKLGSGINWDIKILSRIEILKGILGDLVE